MSGNPVVKYVSLSEAVPLLEGLTGLRLDYDLFRKRIERARAAGRLPAPVDSLYLRRWGREAQHLRADDLPTWAAWLREHC